MTEEVLNRQRMIQFDKECRIYGYKGIEDFEKSIIEPLYLHRELLVVCVQSPAWLIESLKNYYGLDIYLSKPVGGNVFKIGFKNKKILIDDNTLNNYFG